MPSVKTRKTLVEGEVEYGLEREVRQANFTRYKRDKMQCLKDYQKLVLRSKQKSFR